LGLLSYPRRHLFSEGPSRKNGDVDNLLGRLLWSLMAQTGLCFAWPLVQRAKVPPDHQG
jgi:hypothetical protein